MESRDRQVNGRMKILIVNNMVPFLRGGAESLATNLVRHLRRYGHDADLLRVPFRWEPAHRILDEMLACRMMRVNNVDRIIGLKFPAYLIPHPHKTLWVVHQFRQAYDLAESGHSHLVNDPTGQELRRSITAADNECLAESDGISTISRVVSDRMLRFNNVPSHVLHPPVDDADDFKPLSSDNYIFCGGRINSFKRQKLLVQAMRHTTSKIKLVVAGPPDNPADGVQLERIIDKHKLHDRVTLELGFLKRERLVDLVNRSLACAYVPYDEDYGYVTLEAFYAGKPVITTHDAGGVLDFVTDQLTGRIVDPTPESLANAIDEFAENRQATVALGKAARDDIHDRNINWPSTVRRLVA